MPQDYEFRYRGEDPIKRVQQAFRSFNLDLRVLGGIAFLVVLIIAGFGSYYTVELDEKAVILRFGRFLDIAAPGLHFKFPFGVDQVFKLQTQKVQREQFGFRTEDAASGRLRRQPNYSNESLMVTGDLNLANVEWEVQYRISDPRKYLFNVKEPEANIQDISQAVMRRVIGDRLFNDVVTGSRQEIAIEAQLLTQQILDEYNMGIRIEAVLMQPIIPPERVKASYEDVVSARQEQEQLIKEAEKEYNEVIPRARGEKEEKISEARGKAAAILNRATGDAERFLLVFKEYEKAPEITKKRLYLDTMEKLIKRYKRVTIVDDSLKGLLPVFDSAAGGVR